MNIDNPVLFLKTCRFRMVSVALANLKALHAYAGGIVVFPMYCIFYIPNPGRLALGLCSTNLNPDSSSFL